MKKTLIILLCCGFLQKAFTQDYSQLWSDINYTGSGQTYHNMDIYLPSTVKDSYPVVIYIYGSAWYSNDGKGADMTTVGAALLDAGFAVVTPNHRSSSDALFPAQIHDIKAVIRFIRGNSEQYNLDTSFVAISGSSSGGHLAAMAGTTNGVDEQTIGSATMDIEGDLGDHTSMSSSVDAVVNWFGPIDFHRMNNCNTHNTGSSPEADIIGGPIEQNLDEAALLGPINYVDSTDPPFLIFHGEQDNVVPHCQSEFLNDALNDAGVESELVLMPDGQHGPGVNDVSENHQTMIDFLTELSGSTDEPSEQLPFNDTPHAIPGTIQAQDYDLGGQDLAYSEATEENEGGDYRPDEWVGIEANPVEDGDYHIGWTEADEWIEYTVEVAEAGDYDITYRVASGGNGELALLFDDMQVDQVEVPSTSTADDWWTDYTYTDVVTEDVTLEAGEQVMRVEIIEGDFNLNYIDFSPSVVTSTEQEEHLSIQCYPNPSNDVFHLEADGEFHYVLSDINGVEQESGVSVHKTLIGSNLLPGIYVLKLSTNEHTWTRKLIKK